MKKLLALLSIICLFSGIAAFAAKSVSPELEMVPVFNGKSEQQNRVWVGTFQMVWNDFMNEVVGGPVKFKRYNSKLANELNKQAFTADMISENSYYKTFGIITPQLKADIEKALKEKFNETSDILDMIDWAPGPGKFLVYAMLKKDFKFFFPFDVLEPEQFGKNPAEVQYFGIKDDSEPALDDTLNVMFYNGPKDFAVKINTDGPDKLVLYRTDDNKTFDELYKDLNKKSVAYKGNKNFTSQDKLKIPNLNLYRMVNYPELSGHEIKGTDGMSIDNAIQTVDFKLDNEGVKLKSEAALIMKMSMPVPVKEARDFYFNDTFVMFLQENNLQSKPYFALRVNDVELINKTAKKK